MTLVIMAAGMGSRFGGLKQIEPVGPNGEFIIDYSIYDAKRVGFDKIVFIIKEENYELFKKTIGARIENTIEVEYVFQDINNIPDGVKIPKDRVKPLGTAHAIMCLKGIVKEPFTIINADDFYGFDAYKCASKCMKNDEYACITYMIGNTLSESGKVKRGYCESKDGYLTNIIESNCIKENDKVLIEPLDGRTSFYTNIDSLVSMNMFVFKPDIIDYIYNHIESFFRSREDLEKCEYLIPDVVFERINKGEIKVRICKTNSVWYGITYKEDKQLLVDSISKLIKNNEYPINLYK